MRRKIYRILLFLTLMLVCVSIAYFVGYGRGYAVTTHRYVRCYLPVYLSLYNFERQGDTNTLDDRLKMLILMNYDYYERHYASEPVDDYFRQQLAEAGTIANHVRTNLATFNTADVIRQINRENETNRVPNTALEATPHSH